MNLNHLFLLLNRQWLESRKAWLIGSLSLSAILCFLFLLIYHWRTSFNGDTINGVFLLLLFGGGGIFISTILKDLANKQKGIWLLILPASAFEKLSVAIFYGIIFYLLVYLGIFYISEATMQAILGRDASSLHQIKLLQNGFYQYIFTFINFQSLILLGSICFNKTRFLKTLLIIIAGGFLLYNSNTLLLAAITKETTITSSVPLESFQFVHHNENVYVNSTERMQVGMSILSRVIIPITLWMTTWLKIKEKEL